MANKSIAETVDFGNAVQAKAYEKKAQQVDTFVQSESAEQKLARSGKMQTAKAITALAELGGSIQQYRAGQAQERVEQLRTEIVEITSEALAEGEQAGVHWSETQRVKDLPKLILIDIAQRAGERNSLNKQNQFNLEIAKDATILEDADRHAQLVSDIFDPVGPPQGADNAYSVMTQAREEERNRAFLQKAAIKHEEGLNTKLVKERMSDMTMVVNDHIGNYDRNNYDSDEAFVKDIYAGMAASEQVWNKTNGLKGSQLNAVIQDAVVKYAQDFDMPELINNDFIPKQYRSGEFDSYAEQERKSLLTKMGDAAIRKAQLEKIERDEHERAMEDDAYKLHLQGFIDLDDPENIAKGKVFLKKAKEYNDLFTSASYNFGKVGNLQILKANIMRSLTDGSPLRDVKGNEIPMENMTLQSLIHYVRKTPHLTPDMKEKLIPDLANVMTMSTLEKSMPMVDGQKYVKDYIKRMYVPNKAMEAELLYRDILRKNWQAAQYTGAKDNPDYDLNYDDAALTRLLNESLAEWENHYLITGAENPDASDNVGTTNALGNMAAERNAAKDRVSSKTQKGKPLPEAYLADYWRRYEIDPEAANKIITDNGYAIPTKK